jgi:hypothetical protein
MQPVGRRGGVWRCPVCRGIFVDTRAMRRYRAGPPPWFAVLAVGLGVVLVTRLLRCRCRNEAG